VEAGADLIGYMERRPRRSSGVAALNEAVPMADAAAIL
jgi:hypothetical protein